MTVIDNGITNGQINPLQFGNLTQKQFGINALLVLFPRTPSQIFEHFGIIFLIAQAHRFFIHIMCKEIAEKSVRGLVGIASQSPCQYRNFGRNRFGSVIGNPQSKFSLFGHKNVRNGFRISQRQYRKHIAISK